MSHHYIGSLLCLGLTFITATTVHAESSDSSTPASTWQLTPHLGYTIGGMTPMPFPAEIREIQRFHPTDGLSWGFDLSHRLPPNGALQWASTISTAACARKHVSKATR